LVRDRKSFQRITDNFSTPARLAPDMAFALGPLALPAPARQPLVWLARTDREAVGGGADRPVEATDWTVAADPPLERLRRVTYHLTYLAGASPLFAYLLSRQAPPTYERLSTVRLRWGSELLSAGEVVVCDRLHAHLLCVLLGVPHVVYPDRYGKVRDLYETWTNESPIAKWASDVDAAFKLAAVLLHHTDA
jgi:exopolysaccharide biosynthesis predicted pyruvyltransferase EpsI